MRITRTHNKPEPELHTIVEQIAEKLSNELGISYAWEGKKLVFKTIGVKGHISLTPKDVTVEINKSFFVPVSDVKINEKVNEYFDQYL